MDEQVKSIGARMETLLNPSHFLVEVRIKPTNNIKVFVDGDEGVKLSDLIEYNRKLYRQLEESGAYPDGNFSLEVSSPGVDEPLKLQRQYRKNVGRFVEVELSDGNKREGKLLEATEDGILLEWEEGKGKKKEIKQESVLFEAIKNTTVQIRF